MKKLLCLVLLVSMLTLSFAASADQAYTGDGYTLSYPDTWTVGLDQEGVDFVLMMTDGISNFNMVRTDLGMSFTPEQIEQLLMPMLLSQYQEQFENVTQIEQESPIVLGENTFNVIGFNISMFGFDMYMEQYVTMVGSVAYIFTATFQGVTEEALIEVYSTLSTFTAQ